LVPEGYKSELAGSEAVLLGVDGVSDFDGLHSGKSDDQVRLYAFDCLALSRATTCARCRCQDQPRPPPGVAPLRDMRDRTCPVPRGLRHGPGRISIKAQRSALSGWQVAALDQGQEPYPSGHGPSQRCLRRQGEQTRTWRPRLAVQPRSKVVLRRLGGAAALDEAATPDRASIVWPARAASANLSTTAATIDFLPDAATKLAN
jgi:hypothetical protein